MGVSVPSALTLLGVVAWLAGERVLVGSGARVGADVLAGLAFAFALLRAVRALSRAEGDERSAAGHELASVSFVVLGAALYAALSLGGAELGSASVLAAFAAPAWVGALGATVALRVRAREPLHPRRLVERVRAAWLFGGVLCLGVAANVLTSEHDVRSDLSYRRVTEPGAQVRELVARSSAPLEVVLVFEPRHEVAEAAAPYFAALASLSPAVRVRREDAASDPRLLEAAQVRGNGYVVLALGAGAARRYESFLLGLDLPTARSVLRTLDAHVAHHLSALLVPEKRVYVTYGHGERSVIGGLEEPPLARLSDLSVLLARFNVRLVRLGLAEGLGRGVPKDASAVIVAGAARAFLPEEAEALRSYVAGGGAVLVALEPLVDPGLGPLFSLAGVSPAAGVLVCTESHLVRTRTPLDRELVFSRRLAKSALLPSARKTQDPTPVLARGVPLVLDEPSNASRDVLLRSEPDCFADVDGDRAPAASEERGPSPLVVASSPSGGGRIVVLGDGDFFTDRLLRNDANTMLTLDVMRALLGADNLRSDIVPDEDLPIAHRREDERLFFYATTFVPPFVLFCLAYVRARRRMRHAPTRV